MANLRPPVTSRGIVALGSVTALLFALASACGGGTSAPACRTETAAAPSTPSPAASLTLTVGSYEGTGSPQCISGVGFQPVLVIIKGDTNAWAMWRSSSMEEDSTADFAAGKPNSFWEDSITSLDPDAFSLGKNANVNAEGVTFHYAAFADSPDIDVGSYLGDGVDGRTISVGFQPAVVFLKLDQARSAVWSSAAHPEGITSGFNIGDDATNFILGLDADGFQVGSEVFVNAGTAEEGSTYHYVAFRESPGRLKTGTYIGNGSDNQEITDVGFQPDYVWIKWSTGENRTVHRTSSLTGDATLQFGNEPNQSDQIKALRPDGFRVGSHPSVNFDGDTYYYTAWKSGP